MDASPAFPQGLLDDLASFPARLRRQVEPCAPALLDYAPTDWTGSPAENMTVRAQVCHLRDIETLGYHARFSHTLAEEAPFLPSIDGHKLAVERGYDATPLGAALADFEAARAKTVRMLMTARPNDLSRAAEFEGHGRITVMGLAHLLASHDSQHLAGIYWLLAK
jgi:hypothetical protein